MKKSLTILLLALGSLTAGAQKKPIELKAYTEYEYNHSSGHHGALAVSGMFPVNEYFELRAGLNAATENAYAVDGRAVVNFPVRTGKLMLENRINYHAVARNLTHHLSAGISLGYRTDHLRTTLGGYSRLYGPMNDSGHTGNIDYLTEPFNLLWSVEGRLRRDSDFWNIGLRLSNFDDFQIERSNQPIVTLTAECKPADSIRFFAEAFCKPAGVFHMAANHFGSGVRFGISYDIAR